MKTMVFICNLPVGRISRCSRYSFNKSDLIQSKIGWAVAIFGSFAEIVYGMECQQFENLQPRIPVFEVNICKWGTLL